MHSDGGKHLGDMLTKGDGAGAVDLISSKYIDHMNVTACLFCRIFYLYGCTDPSACPRVFVFYHGLLCLGHVSVLMCFVDLASVWQASQLESGNSRSSAGNSIDPSIVNSMVDLLSTFSKGLNDAESDSDNVNKKTRHNLKEQKKDTKEEPSIDWETMLSYAG